MSKGAANHAIMTEDEAADNQQYLTFFMADEEYGVDILSVQEIRGWESATPLPNAPSHVKGVINLRGTIVPLTDLRQRFGIEIVEYGPLTVVIVLKVVSEERERIVGIVVDAVSDVYSLNETMMKSAPEMGTEESSRFIRGLATVGEGMLILLNMNELLAADEVNEVLGA